MKTIVELKTDIASEVAAKAAIPTSLSIINLNEIVSIFESEIKSAVKEGLTSIELQYFPYTTNGEKANFDIIWLDATTRDALLADIRSAGFTVKINVDQSFIEFKIILDAAREAAEATVSK